MTKFSILLALNLAALALVFLYVRSRVRKALESDGLIDKLRAEVGELVRDLNQTTDRNLTLVEDAIRALREASAEADRKTAVLRRETERRSTENAVYDRLGRMRNAASVSEEGAVSPPKAEGPRKPVSAAEALPLFDSSRQETVVAPSREAPQEAIPFVSFSSTPIRPKPTTKEEVMGLSRRGISSEFIAAKLGITVAEVELIISLEEQKGLLSREEGT